ncbi:MAG: 5'-nucleotidase C-terminal domain-containing protein, partial [bacterium]|nr:5'-nucleotidase C-terminal domain-containing protein [bacterium]
RVDLIQKLHISGHSLVLDAGDALGPQALSWFDDGATMAFAMSRAGVAAMLPGNLDLTLGLDKLLDRQKEALFPMVLSNAVGKKGASWPFSREAIVKVGDILVGVVGAIDPRVVETVPHRMVSGVTFGDPLAAINSLAEALRAQGASLVVALTHMDETKTIALARKMEGVDLVVAGGYDGLDRPGGVPNEIRLLNGLVIVTTPRYGVFLGQVDILMGHSEDGSLRVKKVGTQLLPIGESLEEDSEVASRVAELEARYDLAAKMPLGRISAETIEEQGELVAGVMRRHTRTEVGIVNRGSIRRMEPHVGLTRGDVDELIRFDDRLVKMLLTGKQLKSIATRSNRSARDASRVMVMGFDLKSGTINGRALLDDEAYRVTTTEFLADGGDGYPEFRSGSQIVHTGIALRGLMATILQDTSSVVGVRDLSDHESQSIWRANWGIEGAFNRNYIDGTTLAYRVNKEKVSFLSGETSVSWNAIVQWALTRDMGNQIIRFENRLSFGQVGTTFGNLEKSEDQFDADVTYAYRTRNFVAEPFGSVGYSTALTASDGQRPKLVKSSAGFQRRVKHDLLVRLGARAQRDLVAHENDMGLELGLDGSRKFKRKGQLRSRMRGFFGANNRRVISIENYNTLSFPLLGGLRMSARQSNFLYRVNKIGKVPVEGIAFRWDLTVGLVYDLDWKWY